MITLTTVQVFMYNKKAGERKEGGKGKLFDVNNILEEISSRFGQGKVEWTFHARERFMTREIDRRWVKSQIASKQFSLVEFIWRYGFPTKVLMHIGTPKSATHPVHVQIEHTSERTRVVTIYWVDYNKFEHDGLTRKREG